MRKRPSDEELVRLHRDKGLTPDQIAKRYNCFPASIRYKLKVLGVYSVTRVTPAHGRLSDKNLVRLYVDQGLKISQIAKSYGYSKERIRQRLRSLGIAHRPVSVDPETLRHLYTELLLSQKEIAKKLGVGEELVSRELRRHNIPRPKIPLALDRAVAKYSRAEIEELYVVQGLTQQQCAKHLGLSTLLFQALLGRLGITHRHVKIRRIKDTIRGDDLRRLYIVEELSMASIAGKYGCSTWLISHYLRKFGIRKEHRTK